jgi:hypothetical protein
VRRRRKNNDNVTLLDSLLDAIIRLDGEALVMHVGEKPYVVLSSASVSALRGPLSWGQVELSSRPLTGAAMSGLLGQMLSEEQRRSLDDLGAIEEEIEVPGDAGGRFIVTAARGGEDVWVEVRRRKEPVPIPAETPAPVPDAAFDAAVAEPAASTPDVSPAAPLAYGDQGDPTDDVYVLSDAPAASGDLSLSAESEESVSPAAEAEGVSIEARIAEREAALRAEAHEAIAAKEVALRHEAETALAAREESLRAQTEAARTRRMRKESRRCAPRPMRQLRPESKRCALKRMRCSRVRKRHCGRRQRRRRARAKPLHTLPRRQPLSPNAPKPRGRSAKRRLPPRPKPRVAPRGQPRPQRPTAWSP